LKKLNKDEIHRFSIEQMAGLILYILREYKSGRRRVNYYGSSTYSIVCFEISPIWLGMENGILKNPDGTINTYAGDRPPKELTDIYEKACHFLRVKDLIRDDPTQSASEFVILTEQGEKIEINPNFELDLIRDPKEIIKKFKESVFLMETNSNGEISCGSCFLLENSILLTCRHNIEERDFKIIFNDNLEFDKSFFNITPHETRDLAILKFKDRTLNDLMKDFLPLNITNEKVELTEQLITLGYPKIAQRTTQLLTDLGICQGYTRDYWGNEYITFSNRISGGFSGGPVITLKGKVVGIITEATEQTTGSNAVNTSEGTTYYHGTPSEFVFDLL
jgi:S1-C subfamily serine protease